MNTPAAPNLPATLDAARLSRELADQIRPRLRPNTHLVGLYEFKDAPFSASADRSAHMALGGFYGASWQDEALGFGQ